MGNGFLMVRQIIFIGRVTWIDCYIIIMHASLITYLNPNLFFNEAATRTISQTRKRLRANCNSSGADFKFHLNDNYIWRQTWECWNCLKLYEAFQVNVMLIRNEKNQLFLACSVLGRRMTDRRTISFAYSICLLNYRCIPYFGAPT